MTRAGPSGLAARILEQSERTLSAEEARAYLAAPISDDEREEILSLIRWFRRRYSTPGSRLAYLRRAYARWRRSRNCENRTSDDVSSGTYTTNQYS